MGGGIELIDSSVEVSAVRVSHNAQNPRWNAVGVRVRVDVGRAFEWFAPRPGSFNVRVAEHDN